MLKCYCVRHCQDDKKMFIVNIMSRDSKRRNFISGVERVGQTKGLLLIMPLFLFVMPIGVRAQAQTNLTEYDNQFFTIGYPSDWTINDTGTNGSWSVGVTHAVKFHTPSDRGWTGNATLDKSYWLKYLESSSGYTVTMIDNETNYVDRQQALVATLTNGIVEEKFVVTFIPINLPNVHAWWMYWFMYASHIDGYPTYLYTFQTMLAKFHANA
jgi:hypothetical protein